MIFEVFNQITEYTILYQTNNLLQYYYNITIISNKHIAFVYLLCPQNIQESLANAKVARDGLARQKRILT